MTKILVALGDSNFANGEPFPHEPLRPTPPCGNLHVYESRDCACLRQFTGVVSGRTTEVASIINLPYVDARSLTRMILFGMNIGDLTRDYVFYAQDEAENLLAYATKWIAHPRYLRRGKGLQVDTRIDLSHQAAYPEPQERRSFGLNDAFPIYRGDDRLIGQHRPPEQVNWVNIHNYRFYVPRFQVYADLARYSEAIQEYAAELPPLPDGETRFAYLPNVRVGGLTITFAPDMDERRVVNGIEQAFATFNNQRDPQPQWHEYAEAVWQRAWSTNYPSTYSYGRYTTTRVPEPRPLPNAEEAEEMKKQLQSKKSRALAQGLNPLKDKKNRVQKK